MSVWIYSIAVAISLPKQLAVVYLGVMFGETAQVSDPATIHKQRIISLSVFFGTAVASILAAYVCYMKARKLCTRLGGPRTGFFRIELTYESRSQTLKSSSKPTSAKRPKAISPHHPAIPTSPPTLTPTLPSK